MAEGKKSFVFYCDWKETFDALPDDKAGQLIKHILRYVNDENPQTDDVLINAVFAGIKSTLKRDLKKWETFIEKQRENGKRGGRPRKPKKPKPFSENPTKAKKADSVSVSVSDNVNDTSTDVDVYTPTSKLFDRYTKDTDLISAVVKNKSNPVKSEEHLFQMLGLFNDHLQQTADTVKTYKDYCSHFLNWVKKQKAEPKPYDHLKVPL